MDEDRARELLRRERERIETALAGQVHAPHTELATDDQHLGDEAAELYEDELATALRDQLTSELAALERAEERLEQGTYGVSVESGEPIPDERLEAIPWASLCLDDKRKQEGG